MKLLKTIIYIFKLDSIRKEDPNQNSQVSNIIYTLYF